MNDLPLSPCPKCGSKETQRLIEAYEGGCAAEYSLYCKVCGEYLGFFCYGSWEY